MTIALYFSIIKAYNIVLSGGAQSKAYEHVQNKQLHLKKKKKQFIRKYQLLREMHCSRITQCAFISIVSQFDTNTRRERLHVRYGHSQALQCQCAYRPGGIVFLCASERFICHLNIIRHILKYRLNFSVAKFSAKREIQSHYN